MCPDHTEGEGARGKKKGKRRGFRMMAFFLNLL
jgi:hypothetical protein